MSPGTALNWLASYVDDRISRLASEPQHRSILARCLHCWNATGVCPRSLLFRFSTSQSVVQLITLESNYNSNRMILSSILLCHTPISVVNRKFAWLCFKFQWFDHKPRQIWGNSVRFAPTTAFSSYSLPSFKKRLTTHHFPFDFKHLDIITASSPSGWRSAS